jgi:putative zinc finger protein
MNDCERVEFRDRLPELLHERLDVEERAVLMAHIELCADCRAELELLRGVRAVLVVAPVMDIDRIVHSLPSPNQRRASARGLRGRFAEWQLAAAAVVLLAGGASLTMYARGGVARPIVDSNVVASVKAAPSTSRTETVAPKVEGSSENELAVGADLSDLTPGELTRLLSDVERLEPLPQTEPDIGTVSTEAPGDSS